MSATDFDLLALYWKAEPWGPWRDNMHAALIAREIRRPWTKDQTKNLLSDFIIRDPEERAEADNKKVAGFFTFFKTVAKKIKSSDVKIQKRKRKKVKP